MANKIEQGQKEEKEIKEKKFPVEVLRQNCVLLFGVTTCTFDGAAYNRTGEFTVEEMKNVISNWGKAASFRKEAGK